MNQTFYQELAKLAAKKRVPQGYQAAILGHELGHAQDFENRRVPNLRKAVERGAEWGGRIGSVVGVLRGNAGVAAAARGLGQVPTLVDEATASYKALKELERTKAFSPEESKKMRRHLLSAGATYLGQAAVQTGMAAGAATAVKHGVDPFVALPLGLAASIGVGVGLGKLMHHVGKGSPVITEAQGRELKKQMKVQADIYRGKKNLPGVAAYVMKYPGKWTREQRLKVISSMLPGKKKTTRAAAKKMLRDGGIITSPHALTRKRDLTRMWPGMQKKAAKEKKPSLAGRIAKGVGLGAVTVGTAGGITALALGKRERGLIGRNISRKVKLFLAERGLAKKLGKKGAEAAESAGNVQKLKVRTLDPKKFDPRKSNVIDADFTRTKTSASPWSTLGAAVAR